MAAIARWQWVRRLPPRIARGPAAPSADWPGWQELTASIGERVQVVGDDLFAHQLGTDPPRHRRALANSLHMDEAEVVLQQSA